MDLNMKLRKVTIWALALSLLNIGCIAFHPESLDKDSSGYYTRHYNSCGPVALERAFKRLGEENANRVDISKEIQDGGNGTRLLMTLVHHDTILVTMPKELKDVCDKHGYKVINLKDLSELDPKKDIAIILLFGNILKGESHWACFPVDGNIESHFGSGTTISKIYLLKKEN